MTANVRGTIVLLAIIGLVLWWMWRRWKKTDDPTQLVVKWVFTAGVFVAAWFTIDWTAKDAAAQVAGVVQAMVYGLILAILWGRNIAGIVANRVGNWYDGGDLAADPKPLYSIAEAKRKQGKYREAIYEIQNQLALFPRDVTGQMMMAEIQAAHLADLAGAEMTITRFCQQPGHPPKNLAYAWNLLADLHLQYGLDPEAARQALEQITIRLPDTPEAHQAAQRIAHLADKEYLIAKHDAAPLAWKSGARDLGLKPPPAPQTSQPSTAETQAADFVRRLEEHPEDDDTREKLAALYATHYQRLDLATDQLEQLIDLPQQSPKQVAHYLNFLADLQIQNGAEFAMVQHTLQRIIERNPQAAVAEKARQRLALLKFEYKRTEQSHSLKLGTYEKDLGLKNRSPQPKAGAPSPPESESEPE